MTQKQVQSDSAPATPELVSPTQAEAPQIQNTLEDLTLAELKARDLAERLKPKRKRVIPVCCCGVPSCEVMEEPLRYVEVDVEEE